MYALPLAFVALLAGQVAASEVHTHAVRSTISGLLARQSGITLNDIPPECQSDCSTAVNVLNTCTEIDCLCSSNTHNGLATCLQCAIRLQNGTDTTVQSQAQGQLNDYEDACKGAGKDVGHIDLSKNGAASVAASSGAILGAIGATVVALVL